MKNDLIKNKFFSLLFIFPLTYIIGIAVVEFFLFIFLIFLFWSDHKKEFFNRAIIFSDKINIEKKPADEKLKIFNKIDALIRSVNSYNNISQGYPISESTFLNFIKS